MRKDFLKKCAYCIFSTTEDGIWTALKDRRVVSFDVFDTLVLRAVEHPEDVFALVERKLVLAGGERARGFADLRVRAEEAARRRCAGREVTLSEIYDEMPVDQALRDEWQKLECQMEIDISMPNIRMKRVYDACVSRQKEVYLISDMYLPAETVRSILTKNGYDGGRLYVSSESGLMKRGGDLFAFVQRERKLERAQWCHVGDSIFSDFLVPRRMGIHARLIRRNPVKNPYTDKRTLRKSRAYRTMNHFINSRMDCYDDPYERIGYAVLGPILYGFSRWLESAIPEDELPVFSTREGKLLREAFRITSERRSVYLQISRRSANNAYLGVADAPSEASQRKYRTIVKRHTAKELALGYGLAADVAQSIFEREGIRGDSIVLDAEAEARIVSAIWPEARRWGAAQHDLLQRYLNQIGIEEKCALVDVGWLGTIQLLLEKSHYRCGESPVSWSGYYIGVNRSSQGPNIHAKNRSAFLYVDDENLDESHRRIRDCIIATVSFFEMLFLSTEGTTESYAANEQNGVEAILGNSDNGDIVNRGIASLQGAALAFVKDYALSPASLATEVDAMAAIGNYVALAAQPSMRTLKLFRDFRYRDGDKGRRFVSEHKLGYYLLRPKRFALDFYNSTCKAWFLKSLLKLPIPYVALISALRSSLADRRLAK